MKKITILSLLMALLFMGCKKEETNDFSGGSNPKTPPPSYGFVNMEWVNNWSSTEVYSIFTNQFEVDTDQLTHSMIPSEAQFEMFSLIENEKALLRLALHQECSFDYFISDKSLNIVEFGSASGTKDNTIEIKPINPEYNNETQYKLFIRAHFLHGEYALGESDLTFK